MTPDKTMAHGSARTTSGSWDAVVVGGGHNGLVAAAYLARAGLRVQVLERRERVGGASVTEEPFPGYRFSVFSYLVSLLRPEVIHDLDLVRHGLFLVPLESTLNPLPGGDELYRESDPYRTFANVARHSRRDAEAYGEYKLRMTQLAQLVFELQATAPPELLDGAAADEDAAALAALARRYVQAPRDLVFTFLQTLTTSAETLLDQWFESAPLKAALATSSIIGSFLSPRSPGSAYVLLHHYMGELDGVYRGWGWQKGGTGGLAEVIARAARAQGAEIRTAAPVARLLVEGGETRGVLLEDGEEVRAPLVLSSLAPQTSLGRFVDPKLLPGDLLERARGWQSLGCSGKVNLALDRVPRFASRPEPGPHLAGGMSIAPDLDTVERAFEDAKYGSWSRQPFADLVIPSCIDPDMAPPGKHVMSCFVQYAPYRLAGADWDHEREAFGDAVIDVLEEHMPGLRDSILYRQVLVPPDIERIVGIPGGNIFHGELRMTQLFANRPGARAAAYRTPVPGYYLCGSSTHPGGGISGAPGRLAALRALHDLERPVETRAAVESAAR
jgi:phytoene dehydrogenase-like protein